MKFAKHMVRKMMAAFWDLLQYDSWCSTSPPLIRGNMRHDWHIVTDLSMGGGHRHTRPSICCVENQLLAISHKINKWTFPHKNVTLTVNNASGGIYSRDGTTAATVKSDLKRPREFLLNPLGYCWGHCYHKTKLRYIYCKNELQPSPAVNWRGWGHTLDSHHRATSVGIHTHIHTTSWEWQNILFIRLVCG